MIVSTWLGRVGMKILDKGQRKRKEEPRLKLG
jgi:hypothetical protein